MQSVLIVDDEPTVRKVLTETLRDSGFRPIEAESASEALRTLRYSGLDISVLVTDVKMPGHLDGIDLAKLAQKSWPWIKVIVTTGFEESVAKRLPPNVRFLPKPWMPDEIFAHIRGASDEYRRIQAAGSVH